MRPGFVGRAREIARALELAGDLGTSARTGGLLLLAGEPGIGKTHLAERIVAAIVGASPPSSSSSEGARVVWGRCWEAGVGAPPLWPWIQVLRALGHDDGAIFDVAPGDSDGGAPPAAGPDAQQRRFRQLDRAWTVIRSHTRTRHAPIALIVVLDDLHMADVSSLVLLHLIARDLRMPAGDGSRPVLVIGTYRDTEARLSPEVASLLSKIAREGSVFELTRLEEAEVAELVRMSVPNATGESVQVVHTITEGNPLFVHEVLRTRGGSAAALERLAATTRADAARPLGSELRAILDEHLARLDPSTRSVLETASVFGRDIDVAMIAAIENTTRDRIELHLHEAAEAGIVASPAGAGSSFTHILLRERLYESVGASRRAGVHRKIGEHLLRRGLMAGAAHHLLEGRADASSTEHATRIAADAAAQMMRNLAFEDAARLCERALSALAEIDTSEDAQANAAIALHRCDLEIRSAEAQFAIGRGVDAREGCVRAAKLAKAVGSTERHARAALVFATELTTGRIDETMLALLSDALAMLPAEDSTLRARVLARYSSARAPPRDFDDAGAIIEDSRAAIAMARRTGDPETLLYCLEYATTAMGYLIPASAAERHDTLRERMDLATKLDQPLAKLNVAGYLVATLREQGRVAEACAETEALIELIRTHFPQPFYQWRIPMLRAGSAALEGDFARAEALGEDALRLVEETNNAYGRMTWAVHRISLAHLRGDLTSLAPTAERLGIFARLPQPNGFMTIVNAALGNRDVALRDLDVLLEEPRNFAWMCLLGEVVWLLRDKERAERMWPGIKTHAERQIMFWGPHGTLAIGPAARVAADVAAVAGRVDEARGLYEEAIRIGTRMQAPAIITLCQQRLGDVGAASRASAAAAPSRDPSVRTASAPRIELAREGEVWRLTSSFGPDMLLKDGKGLHYLDMLLSRPGSPMHVAQLTELHETETPSDAGPRLDATAKETYRKRIEDLRDVIDEARRNNDPSRADRAEREMEAIGQELASAMGLGGRDRKVGSHIERARINVQRRLRDAIQRIAASDPALGRYLTATIKTGVFCVYEPV